MKTSNEIVPRTRLKSLAVERVVDDHTKTPILRLSLRLPRHLDLRKPLQAILAGTLIFTLVLPLLEAALLSNRYTIQAATRPLLSPTEPHLLEKLKYDATAKAYRFNEDAKRKQAENAVESGAGKFAADLFQDPSNGITLFDPANDLSVKFTPQFNTLDGREKDGYIVYPLIDGKSQLVYTIKGNGLKEDILIERSLGNRATFGYKLDLGESLEARLLDSGALGIYSSDAILHGNITFGSDADREKVEQARQSGAKNNLVFAVPAPVIRDSSGKEYTDRAKFKYENSTLTVESDNLSSLAYPITIDPNFVVTSASDWGKGTNETNIEFDTAGGQIKRGTLIGGTVPSFTAQTPTWNARGIAGGFVYDNNLFMLGGIGDNSIWYTPIATDGTISSTWTQSASTMPGTDYNAYGLSTQNGYLYLSGGQTGGNTTVNTYYIKLESLKSTTSPTSFTQGENLPGATVVPGSAASNGYIYVLGGRLTSTSLHNEIYVAKLRADGSTEAWTTSSSTLSSARWQLATFVYNGRLYYGGGCNSNGGITLSDCGTPQSDVWSAPLGSDGTVGTFVQTASFSGTRGGASLTATNGYAYLAGGCSDAAGSCTGGVVRTDVQYAQINSDGSLEPWQTTTQLTTGRYLSASAMYQGNLYYMGGCNTPSNQACNNSTSYKSVEYVKIRSAGTVGSFSATSSLAARYNNGTAVSDGFVYVVGGCDDTNCRNSDGAGLGYLKSVQYAPINSNGTIGTWSSGGDIPATGTSQAGRMEFAAVANNGYLYIIGGIACNAICNGDDSKADILVGKISTSGGIVASGMSIGACINQNFCAASNNLPVARSRHGAVVNNGFLYVMAGYDGAGQLSSGVYASFGSAGDVNAFSATTSFDNSGFTAARNYFPLVVHAGYMYAIGGYIPPGSSLVDTQRAAINSNGSLGAWSISGNASLPSAVHGPAAAVAGGKVYVMGGASGDSTVLSTVYIGEFNAADGRINSWTTSSTSLASNRGGSGNPGFYSNGQLYFVGGCAAVSGGACTSVKSDADRGLVHNGGSGTTGTGTTSGFSFTTARTLHASVVIRGYLYVIAGCSATSGGCVTATSSVQKSTIAADGSIGTWSAVTATSNSIFGLSAVAYNDHIYAIGGHNLTSAISTVEYTHVKSDGTFEAPVGCGTTWCAGTSLPSIRSNHSSTIYNGYIYTLGGNTTATALYIKINSDGSLAGSWSTGTSMPSALDYPDVAAQNGYLHVLGGWSTPISTTDGSILGSWTQTTAKARAQSTGGSIAFNGYAYVFGGSDGLDTAAVQYAPFFGGGKVGNWDFAINNLSGARTNTRAVYYNGRAYVTGGNSGPTLLATTRYFTLKSIPRVANYSRLVDFDNGVKPTKLIARGSKKNGTIVKVDYQSVNNTANSFTNSQAISDIGYSALQTLNIGSGVTLSRYLLIRYTIDETQSAIFPDSGNETTITNYDTYFIANPVRRLRGGKTFTGGEQRGLDAQP